MVKTAERGKVAGISWATCLFLTILVLSGSGVVFGEDFFSVRNALNPADKKELMEPNPSQPTQGSLFQRATIPGLTDIQNSTMGAALTDIDHDGLTDIITVYQTGQFRNITTHLNKGHFVFSSVDQLLPGQYEIPNLVDFNNDGWLDIFTTSTWTGNLLGVSNGTMDSFVDISSHHQVLNTKAYNRQSSFGDVDGDGWLDIAVGADNIATMKLGVPRQRLYHFVPTASNTFEDGHYVDIGGSPLIPGFGGEIICTDPITRTPPTSSSGPDIHLRDMDNDGDLDLIQSYHADMNPFRGAPWEISPGYPARGIPPGMCASGESVQGVSLWRNLLKETGTFQYEKVVNNGLVTEGRMTWDSMLRNYFLVRPYSEAIGLAYVSLADVDNDGLLDVLAVGPSDPEWVAKSGKIGARFWRNLGNMQFQEATSEAGLDALNWNYQQWGTFQGSPFPPDVCQGSFPCPPCPAGFEHLCTPFGEHLFYAGDAVFGDFNNDSWIDFLFVDRRELYPHEWWRNVLFINTGQGIFQPVPTSISGIDTNGMAAETADLNNDGLLDIFLIRSPGNSGILQPFPAQRREDVVYVNTGMFGASSNHWLRVRFSGISDPRLIGTRVETFASGSTSRLGTRSITTNKSYKSSVGLDVHFGLGKYSIVDLRVTLPEGTVLEFNTLDADQYIDVNLVTGIISPIP